jgi:hypothetical protein
LIEAIGVAFFPQLRKKPYYSISGEGGATVSSARTMRYLVGHRQGWTLFSSISRNGASLT